MNMVFIESQGFGFEIGFGIGFFGIGIDLRIWVSNKKERDHYSIEGIGGSGYGRRIVRRLGRSFGRY